MPSDEKQTRMHALCALIAQEKDNNKALQLIRELNEILQQNERGVLPLEPMSLSKPTRSSWEIH